MEREATRGRILPLQRQFLPFLILFILLLNNVAFGQKGKDKFTVVLDPPEATRMVGEEVAFTAILEAPDGTQKDTTFLWSIQGNQIGTIDQNGVFTALSKGTAHVVAAAGKLSGKAKVKITEEKTYGTEADSTESLDEDDLYQLQVSPEDTIVVLGEEVQYRAFLVDSLGNRTDTTATWRAQGRDVGTIDMNGIFTATACGVGVIKAKAGSYASTTKVIVSAAVDSASTDSVSIWFRGNSCNPVGNVHRTGQGDVYKISGFPFPYNVLNGGEIVFQPGCLDEDIQIDITLSETARIMGDSLVEFGNNVLNGISLQVYMGDSLVSPFYFDPPVEVVLPYKVGLMNTLGLTPDDLWMYFYSDSAGLDSAGISNIVVDSAKHKIYAEVSHFSDLVIAPKGCACPAAVENSYYVPTQHSLSENYPNPFNPETIIPFTIGGSEAQRIRLAIYNLVGQEIRRLADRLYSPGVHSVRWDGKDNTGRLLASGIYIYRLETKTFSQSRRMVLLR
jgi:hypothetical protein